MKKKKILLSIVGAVVILASFTGLGYGMYKSWDDNNTNIETKVETE